MKAIPAARAARGGLAGRRLQAVVIGLVVLAATAASTLALGLLADANVPFDRAFSARHGAQVTATVSTSLASPAELAATTRLPAVTAASGPFPGKTVTVKITEPGVPGALTRPLRLTGRASPGGPVDDLTLDVGRWAQRTGEVVWAQGRTGMPVSAGQQITVTGVPGSPRLTVVGVATSVTGTAQAWVLPAEITALGGSGTAQMQYRFASAGSAGAVSADIAAIRAALPPGAVLGTPQSYLTVKELTASQIAPWVPFIVAFGAISLVMSVLIVVNVVSGAVVAGTRRIGVLKSIGFTPLQVTAAYVLQVAVPALAGCVAGVAGGVLLSAPLLGLNARVYRVGALSVPLWVDATVPLAVLALTCVAAVAPALRAGRMSAVQAIATGRAPRSAHGYAANRLLGRVTALPRAVTIGLAGPFARPARTFVTLAAILFGAVAVTFGAGLGASLSGAAADLSLARSEPVQVQLAGGPPRAKPGEPRVVPNAGRRDRQAATPGAAAVTGAQQQAVVSALRAQPGTRHYVAETGDQLSVAGLSNPLSVTAFGGDASWTGYGLVAGRWYSGAGEVDVNTYFLTATGTRVGDTYTLSSGGRQVAVQIVGEVFEPSSTPEMFTSSPTLAAVDPGLAPRQYDVGLTPGTDVRAYANRLSAALGPSFVVGVSRAGSPLFTSVLVLVAVLTVLLMAVAGLGVLNTVVLQIRERVHDLGVFKAVGMTPRQTVAMVLCSVTGIGLVAGLIAIPAGTALHQFVVPIMGHAAQSDVPAALLNVYRPWELVLLALSGLLIAAAGALAPAGWAAGSRTASALRAE